MKSSNIIKNKFPDEALPLDGKILNYFIEDGKIKGINGQRRVDFVINREGNLVLGKKHQLLGNADDVMVAGQLKIDGKPYSYTERSLPYVEDLSNYHQYEVIGDFSKLEDYVKNCSDIKLKTQIDVAVTKYYDGDYSKLISYKGEIAGIKAWEAGGGINQ